MNKTISLQCETYKYTGEGSQKSCLMMNRSFENAQSLKIFGLAPTTSMRPLYCCVN